MPGGWEGRKHTGGVQENTVVWRTLPLLRGEIRRSRRGRRVRLPDALLLRTAIADAAPNATNAPICERSRHPAGYFHCLGPRAKGDCAVAGLERQRRRRWQR